MKFGYLIFIFTYLKTENNLIRIFLITFISVLFSLNAIAQNTVYLNLFVNDIKYKPNGFYVDKVVDDRKGKASLGVKSKGNKSEFFDFEGHAQKHLSAYMELKIVKNTSKQSIEFHLIESSISSKYKNNVWITNIAITFAIYIDGRKLVDYTGNGKSESNVEPEKYIEQFIAKTIEHDLKTFDDWWVNNKSKVPTSDKVKMNVVLSTQYDKPDCIPYIINQPLKIEDFKGIPVGDGQEMAITASGIGFKYTSTINDGQILLDIVISPNFNKHLSWFKEAGKNPKVLAHEQLHFDITALKACEFVNTLKTQSFHKADYTKNLELVQKQYEDETKEMENRYDIETGHGTIIAKQLEWEKNIKGQLLKTGCYK